LSEEKVAFESEVKAFISADSEIKNLDIQVKAAKQRKAEVERWLLDHFAFTGMTQVKIDGVTVFTKRTLRAGADRQEGESFEDANQRLKDALRTMGHDHLIKETVNSNSLSALIREIDADDDQEMPTEFDGAIKIAEMFSVNIR